MYKRDENGVPLSTRGDEYYDDSIPYEGVYIDYANKIVEVSCPVSLAEPNLHQIFLLYLSIDLLYDV